MRFRRAAWLSVTPGSLAALGRGSPLRWMGLTKVASIAICAPCHSGTPLMRTSIARASGGGQRRFMFVRTRPPASRHILATARSRGMGRTRRNPEVAQAARWSPKGSRAPPQLQRWLVKGGVSGGGAGGTRGNALATGCTRDS